ncbi:hypothetical protein LCG56_28655 (plasmid) [Pseudomonas cannabina pv. alisalensis]|uniref:Uncharacterized protein n=1 Tax=Pseudomonas syringae pv. maculicola str. ES4326 TaxID=629265 RepID=A0A8T8CAT8_PSEYM|nr:MULTISPECIES: hypothetical protein [Pseudomonas syringae group]QHF00731.1 hypothetical protein PMA4326_030025 [Pseudomonas syringae pv. maculicola str. ES4326]UBZ00341.1 hypothetical protein LCG56_28655 [Pseudomonas cannabina pv. alisalensis]
MLLIDNIKRSIQAGIALKNYKSANGIDGRMWSADLMLNGEMVGQLVDQGLGHLETTCADADVSAVSTALKQAGYDLAPGDDFPLPIPTHDFGFFEEAIGLMAAELEDLKALKKSIKHKILFEMDDGKTYEIKAEYTPTLGDLVRKQHGYKLKCIINEELAALYAVCPPGRRATSLFQGKPH